MQRRLLFLGLAAVTMGVAALLLTLPSGTASARASALGTPPNVDVSRRHLNESEEAIAVNPTNPNNIVVVTNVGHREAGLSAGMFEGVSFDGGATWTTSLIGNNDNLGDSCCDPSLSFDEYGNLFLTYLYQVENRVPIALNTDGGLTFNVIANIDRPGGTKASGDNRGLFRYVDQPTIIAGENEVWVVFNAAGPMFATGAPVDGLGPAGFGDRVFVAATHVGGFDFIPPQADRSVDAESGLAWDRTGGSHNGRVYVVYTKEQQNESDNTDVYVRFSSNDGASWSSGVRVNDDATTTSQFLPKISLDPTTKNLTVVWYDSRADLGAGGAGDTDGIPDDDAQFWGAFSTNGGASFTSNAQISAGTSNSHDSGNGIDYGDYSALSFFGGRAHPAWSDNSNSTGTNPDGALHQLDIYTASVRLGHRPGRRP